MPDYVPGTNRTGRPWERIKARVLRGSTVCHLCGHEGADTADHIIPVSHGGEVYDLDNLMPAHHAPCPTCGVPCNRVRGNRNADEVRLEFATSGRGVRRPGWWHDPPRRSCPHSRAFYGDPEDPAALGHANGMRWRE